MTISLTDEALARRRRIPRLAFSILSRLDGSWGEIQTFMREHVLGLYETLERVRRDRLSLARFGDGELLLSLNPNTRNLSQQGSPELQADLQAVLRRDGYEDAPLLVCLPGLSAGYYHSYWAKFWPVVKPLLDLSYTYGDTSVSRETLFLLDPEKGRLAWRSVWDGKDVCYVIGRRSRFEPLDVLFDGVTSSRIVYSQPTDAYADVPRLLEEIAATVPRETLVLLALGPAATILAARLSRLGYWALDIGHVDNTYLTVVDGAPRVETTPLVTAE